VQATRHKPSLRSPAALLLLALAPALSAPPPAGAEASPLAPQEIAALFRQLEDKDPAARQAAVEKLVEARDASVAARLKRTLLSKAGPLLHKASVERARALRAAMAEARKGFSPQAFAARQQEALALFKAGKTKEMEPLVKSMWKDFYFDPAAADADGKAAEAAALVAELDRHLKAAGAEEQELPAAKLAESLRALDESHLIQTMPPRDQKTMLQNAALRSQVPEEEYRLVFMTNQYRVLMGRSALRLDPKLCNAARDHSKDMVEKGFFAHESPVPGKRTPGDRATRAGTSAHAENIAMGSERAEGPFWMWFFSLGHHQNVLGDHATIGVGNHGKTWTEMFG